jgi:hypothetical protein
MGTDAEAKSPTPETVDWEPILRDTVGLASRCAGADTVPPRRMGARCSDRWTGLVVLTHAA